MLRCDGDANAGGYHQFMPVDGHGFNKCIKQPSRHYPGRFSTVNLVKDYGKFVAAQSRYINSGAGFHIVGYYIAIAHTGTQAFPYFPE